MLLVSFCISEGVFGVNLFVQEFNLCVGCFGASSTLPQQQPPTLAIQ